METFWDTSAIVAFLIKEPHTEAARKAWSKTTRCWAWRWVVVETEAALARRQAPPEAWSQWDTLLSALNLLDLEVECWDALRAFNRGLPLRASDAAHLFVCERASTALPGLRLVSFDAEQTKAARHIGLAV